MRSDRRYSGSMLVFTVHHVRVWLKASMFETRHTARMYSSATPQKYSFLTLFVQFLRWHTNCMDHAEDAGSG